MRRIPNFGIPMTPNSYIAIFFSVIFFGKFLVVDSKILVTIFDADKIAYVNPFCKKQNSKIQGNNSSEALAEDSNSLNFTIETFCNAPFNFEIFTWETKIISEESVVYVHYTSSFPESSQDKFYPPPQA